MIQRLLASAAVITCLLPATLAAQDTGRDYKQGVWAHLVAHIGTHNTDAVLNDPAVAAELTRVLGEDEAHLRRNLSVRGPIAFDGDCLSLDGIARHGGGEEHALLRVCPSGRIDAVLYSQGQFTVWSRPSRYDHQPAPIRMWITWLRRWGQEEAHRRPQDVELRPIPCD